MASPSGRRICVACLAVALGALGVDRWILAEPGSVPRSSSASSQEASTPEAGSRAALGGQTASNVAGALSDPARGGPDEDVASRLRGLAAKEGARPAEFTDLVETFLAAPRTREAETSAGQAIEAEPPSVTAVLFGDRPAAIAGGRRVALGATLDGWIVLEINRFGVVFGRDGVRAERRVR